MYPSHDAIAAIRSEGAVESFDSKLSHLAPDTIPKFAKKPLQMLANPGSSSQPPDAKEVREKQALGRSQMLRTCANYLPASAVQQRRNFLAAKVTPCLPQFLNFCFKRVTPSHVSFMLPVCTVQETGVFSRKSEAKGMQEQLMTNPDMMQNMMKQQLTGLVPQVGFVAC